MASKIEICNLALSHLGKYPIQSLGESSKEARECSVLYPFARDSVLEAHDWGFARVNVTLALLTETFTNWAYAYAYPSDCIAPRKILDDDGTLSGTSYDVDQDRYVSKNDVEFDVQLNTLKTQRVIVTNKAQAELRYTAVIDNTELYTPLFVRMLGFHLASDLAIPLTKETALRDRMLDEYKKDLEIARASDANVGSKKPTSANSFVEARV